MSKYKNWKGKLIIKQKWLPVLRTLFPVKLCAPQGRNTENACYGLLVAMVPTIFLQLFFF